MCPVSCIRCPSPGTDIITLRTSFSMSDDEDSDISHGHVSNEADYSDSDSSPDVAPSTPSCSKSPVPGASPVVLPPPAGVARRAHQQFAFLFLTKVKMLIEGTVVKLCVLLLCQ